MLILGFQNKILTHNKNCKEILLYYLVKKLNDFLNHEGLELYFKIKYKTHNKKERKKH